MCFLAQKYAKKFDLGALDALHIAAAVLVEANEFITTEKPKKPLHMVKDVKVISIYRSSLWS
jgi:hypothetical protein